MLKVLVVDDLDINIRVISSILSFRQNVDVVPAIGGKEAISCVEKDKFDIIITDIFMPEMNGFELADIINDNYGAIPIVAVSAGDSDVEDECKQHGIHYFLSKPIIPDRLYAVIDDIGSVKSEMPKMENNNLPESELLDKLKTYTSGNVNLLKKLLAKFIDILPIRVDEINSLLEKDYQTVLEEKIHNLKGFSLVYVSEETGDAIKAYEKLVKSSVFDIAKDERKAKFDELKTLLYRDFEEIKDLFSEL